VAAAAADLARVTGAAAIVAFTSSGTTAARSARKRPEVPILAVTPDESVSRQLSLLWGAHSVRSDNVSSFDEINRLAESHALAEGFAKPGDLIIVVSGVPFGKAGTTNNLRVLQLGVQPSP
jgi:pyruvate kinase